MGRSAMKALTIRQPHATLIALGVKHIETRSWPTTYRGPLAIHAGKHRPAVGWDFPYGAISHASFGSAQVSPSDRCWQPPGTGGMLAGTKPTMLPLGAIVATCKLVDCVPIDDDPMRHNGQRRVLACNGLHLTRVGHGPPDDITNQLPYGDFTPGRWAWLLADIKPTTERCPACWGSLGEFPGGYANCCWTCQSAHAVDPIPAMGAQGLWTWLS